MKAGNADPSCRTPLLVHGADEKRVFGAVRSTDGSITQRSRDCRGAGQRVSQRL